MKIDIIKRYESYREEVREHISFIIEMIIEKYGEVPSSFLLELDLLAMNLDVMYKAKHEIDEKGFQKVDHQNKERKAGWVQQFNSSQLAVFKIIHDFALNPMGQSKIKENKETKDIKKLIKKLSE